MDTYPHFIHVVRAAAGALMRRLDDGSATGGKPGNVHRFPGADDEERARSLRLIEDRLGEGAWNPNRWSARGNVPGSSEEQFDRIEARY